MSKRNRFGGRRINSIALMLLASAAQTNSAKSQVREGGEPSSSDQAQASKNNVGIFADDIVVTARNNEASVKADAALNEADIEAYGTNSIGELLQRISPLISASGEKNVILINGARADDTSGVNLFPPEALKRLEIFSPESGVNYGPPPRSRIINLVLKQHFSSWNSAIAMGMPTAGGRNSQQLSVGRLVVSGSTYWTAQLRLSRDSALLKSERIIPARAKIDFNGHVVGFDTAEIDPQLSTLVTKSLNIVSIPQTAFREIPTLGDFAAQADESHFVSTSDYETLLPSLHAINFNTGLTRPLGPFSASLSINISGNESSQRLGFPSLSLVLPAHNPWSPFSRDVQIVPGFKNPQPLTQTQSSDAVSLSATLSGALLGWRTSFMTNYSRNSSRSENQRGINVDEIQRRINANDSELNPFLPWQRSAFQSNIIRSTSDNINSSVNVSKIVLKIPAGQIPSNFSINFRHGWTSSELLTGIMGRRSQSTIRLSQFNLGMSVSLPITSKAHDVLPFLGDLSVDLAVDATNARGGWQSQFSTGFSWVPFTLFELTGMLSIATSVPAQKILNGPRIETVERIYDYFRQEVADVVMIGGGNDTLGRESQRNFSLKGTLRPFGDQHLTMTSVYRRQTSRGGAIPFPTLTSDIEKSFPDRITRDQSGRLLSIDTRPVGTARNLDEQLETSLVFLLHTGLKPENTNETLAQLRRPLDVTFALNHSWRIKNQFVADQRNIRIDHVDGGGAQSKHAIAIQLSVIGYGLGASLTGDWKSAIYIHNFLPSDNLSNFRYSQMTRANLGLFAEPFRSKASMAPRSLFSKLRVSIDVQNLLNSRQRILSSSGNPYELSRDELDPLGRTVQISLNTRW